MGWLLLEQPLSKIIPSWSTVEHTCHHWLGDPLATAWSLITRCARNPCCYQEILQRMEQGMLTNITIPTERCHMELNLLTLKGGVTRGLPLSLPNALSVSSGSSIPLFWVVNVGLDSQEFPWCLPRIWSWNWSVPYIRKGKVSSASNMLTNVIHFMMNSILARQESLCLPPPENAARRAEVFSR